MKRTIDLGWANGWQGTPEVLQAAAAHNYKTEMRTDYARHITYCRCETEDSIITYRIDES